MLTTKQIYKSVSTHLLQQQAVSEDDNGSCRLRSPDGRKCAIGSLIDDDVYDASLEGLGIAYYRSAADGALLKALYASHVDAYREDVLELLLELEAVHDDADPADWPELLANVGQRYLLDEAMA